MSGLLAALLNLAGGVGRLQPFSEWTWVCLWYLHSGRISVLMQDPCPLRMYQKYWPHRIQLTKCNEIRSQKLFWVRYLRPAAHVFVQLDPVGAVAHVRRKSLIRNPDNLIM